MSCPNFDIATNCADPGSPIVFDADPDVAGIGEVILAFLLSAWATYLFVLITFFFVESFDGTNNELDSRVVQKTRDSRKYIQPFLPSLLKIDRAFSFEAIEKIAFTLSDQQLITGMSILIVGFARHCIITQYHFYIVYLLGLLSYSTHQSTMMIVREKLREKHWMRWWRLAAIFLIFVFSFVANIPVYNAYFLSELGLVMQCMWGILPNYYGPVQIILMTLTSIFLFWGFVAVTRDLCPELGIFLGKHLAPIARFLYPLLRFFSPRGWHYYTREKLAESRQKGRHELIWELLDWYTFCLFVAYFTILQIAGSRIVDLYRVWATLFYATYAVLGIRRQAKNAMTADGNNALNGNEDTWGFGQILPMLLLALPLSQAYEMVREDIEARKEQAKANKENTMSSKSSTTSSQEAENIPSTASSYHAPQRQEVEEYFPIRREGTRENVQGEQNPVDAVLTDPMAHGNGNPHEIPSVNNSKVMTMTPVSKFYKQKSDNQPDDQGQPRRVDTVNLEKANQRATTSGSSVSTDVDEFEVEKKLYDSWWFWIWIWVWILALTGGTTYGAIRGIVF